MGLADTLQSPYCPGEMVLTETNAPTELIDQIRSIWDLARSSAVRSVNSAHVIANWLTGRQIVEFEQGGAERAAYGQEVLKGLSGALMSDFGKGFSICAQVHAGVLRRVPPAFCQLVTQCVTNWRYRAFPRLATQRVTFLSARPLE